jgi:hypothetical protein
VSPLVYVGTTPLPILLSAGTFNVAA